MVKNKQGKQGAQRFLVYQLGLTLFASAVLYFIAGVLAAVSALVGGLVSVIPNAYFAWAVFRYQGAKAARKIVNSVYKGEAMKLFLSLTLFMLVFIYIPINPVIFFVTYILVQSVFWFAPLIFDNKQNRPKSD